MSTKTSASTKSKLAKTPLIFQNSRLPLMVFTDISQFFVKPVANAPGGQYKCWVRHVGLYFSSQTVDMRVHCMFISFKIITPNQAQQLFTAVTPAGIGGQEHDQFKFP